MKRFLTKTAVFLLIASFLTGCTFAPDTDTAQGLNGKISIQGSVAADLNKTVIRTVDTEYRNRVDEDGSYSLVMESPHDMFFTLETASGIYSAYLPAASAGKDVSLSPSWTLRGNTGLENIRDTEKAHSGISARLEGTPFETSTDTEGNFEFRGIPSGITGRIVFSHPLMEDACTIPTYLDESAATKEMTFPDITLKEAYASLWGHVSVYPEGTKVSVALRNDSGTGPLSAVDDKGTYNIEKVEPGTYELLVYIEGKEAPEIISPVVIKAKERCRTDHIQVKPAPVPIDSYYKTDMLENHSLRIVFAGQSGSFEFPEGYDRVLSFITDEEFEDLLTKIASAKDNHKAAQQLHEKMQKHVSAELNIAAKASAFMMALLSEDFSFSLQESPYEYLFRSLQSPMTAYSDLTGIALTYGDVTTILLLQHLYMDFINTFLHYESDGLKVLPVTDRVREDTASTTGGILYAIRAVGRTYDLSMQFIPSAAASEKTIREAGTVKDAIRLFATDSTSLSFANELYMAMSPLMDYPTEMLMAEMNTWKALWELYWTLHVSPQATDLDGLTLSAIVRSMAISTVTGMYGTLEDMLSTSPETLSAAHMDVTHMKTLSFWQIFSDIYACSYQGMTEAVMDGIYLPCPYFDTDTCTMDQIRTAYTEGNAPEIVAFRNLLLDRSGDRDLIHSIDTLEKAVTELCGKDEAGILKLDQIRSVLNIPASI